MSQTPVLAVLIVFVCAAVIGVYWPVLYAQTISFDDTQYLVENELVKNPGLSSAQRFISEVLEPSTVKGYYQPLSMISLMLDYSLGGREENLLPFHRTSLALHAANVALIIVILYMLFGQPWIAAAVGLLFGLHPMTVEPVSWVGERKTLLAAFFALWCLILYIRYAKKNTKKLYIACLVFYLLALLSKPTSVLLPAVMLLLDFWPLKKLKWKSISEKIPFFVLGGIFAVITYISQTRTAASISPGEAGLGRITLVLCHNIIFYLYKIVWPVNLSSHYPFPQPLNLSQPMVLAGVIGTCILIPLLLVSLRWTRAAFTGWLVFFAAIFPAMGVVGFTNVIASDKFAYLPSIGLLMILASFLGWFCKAADIGKPAVKYIAILIIVLAAACGEAAAVRGYLVYWRDSIGYFQHMVSEQPDLYLAYYNLGVPYGKLGRWPEAIEAYKQAIKINQNYAEAYNNLGAAYGKLGRGTEAIDAYKQAVRINPDSARAYNNLGAACSNLKRWPEAIDAYKQAIRIKPDFAEAHLCLGLTYLLSGNKDSAREEYKILETLDAQMAKKISDLINK
jgi:Tfp pilus assembly protein PilF